MCPALESLQRAAITRSLHRPTPVLPLISLMSPVTNGIAMTKIMIAPGVVHVFGIALFAITRALQRAAPASRC